MTIIYKRSKFFINELTKDKNIINEEELQLLFEKAVIIRFSIIILNVLRHFHIKKSP